MNTNTDFADKAAYINSSALFQLSLGSKELFHSNFIAWLARKYPKQIGNLFSPYLKVRDGDLTIDIDKIGREVKNNDIHLHFANGQELIIENKVKSIPYIEQLEIYSKHTTEKQNFLLLTLIRPEFTKTDKIDVFGTIWNTMSYRDLAISLKKIESDITNDYDKLILKDYIKFITFISHELDNIEVIETDKFTFYNPKLDNRLALFQDIRMGDVYLKIKYQSLASLIEKRLVKELPNILINFGASHQVRKKGVVYLGYGMQRAQGVAELSIVVEDGLYASIQLQANRYSQLLQGYAGYKKDTRKYAERLLSSQDWFSFVSSTKKPKIYPTRSGKVFNQYGMTDFYQSIHFDESYSISQILDIIVHDTVQMIKLSNN